MRPRIELNPEIFAANARAWRTFCAPAQLYAVVKADGYGWGLRNVVPLLEPVADGYCVADADELRDLRAFSAKPAIVLGSVESAELPAVIAAGGLPTVDSPDDLAPAAKGASVRIGVRPAAGFSGLSLDELTALIPALTACGKPVSLWTHLTDLEGARAQMAVFEQAHALLAAAGVRVASTDVASTFPLANGYRTGSLVRIGIGLFGATGGSEVPGVGCAVKVHAPLVKFEEHGAGTRLGYGGRMLPVPERIAVARCGYADGVPKTLERDDDILSVGMQYLTVRASRVTANTHVSIIDSQTNLDAFAALTGRLPHEVVTALGRCAA